MFHCRFGHHTAVLVPAKLNLFLEVLGKRADGYHELETLMTTVGIYDRLSVAPRDDGQIALACRWRSGHDAQTRQLLNRDCQSPYEPLPPPHTNLVMRALEQLRQRAGESRGLDVWLEKSIPAAAGLGGASADAAAALMAANKAWNLHWSPTRLVQLASELGSDIPFFMSSGQASRAAVCRGRGEHIEPAGGVPRLPCVVVRPPTGLSTAQVFKACRPASTAVSVEPLLAALKSGDRRRIGSAMYNRLEDAAVELSPWIARLRHWFAKREVVGHQMSGSGTSYFAICRSQAQAGRVAALARHASLGAVFVAATPAP
jgi:4-diphosphocytidyl-2-C-methyl-D-erythritol kinase